MYIALSELTENHLLGLKVCAMPTCLLVYLFLRQSFTELDILARLADHPAPGICLTSPPSLKLKACTAKPSFFLMWVLGIRIQVFILAASTLPAESSPQPPILFFKSILNAISTEHKTLCWWYACKSSINNSSCLYN